MDLVTQTIVNYIEQTDVTNREDLLSVARIAFSRLSGILSASRDRTGRSRLGSVHRG